MNVVILGALSDIAVEIARIYAARGANLGLLGRSEDELVRLQDDLLVRGAGKIKIMALDLSAPHNFEGVIGEFAVGLGDIDIFVLAYGILGDQAQAKTDLSHASAILTTDFTSAALWLLSAAKSVKHSGTIAVFSSVAGDRGRSTNYVYGAAKGGLAVFAQGLAHDLAKSGPNILIIKPGFVITAMTKSMQRSGPLWASARSVAQIVVTAIDKRRGPIIYVPWYWRWIMLIIRLIPQPLMNKLRI